MVVPLYLPSATQLATVEEQMTRDVDRAVFICIAVLQTGIAAFFGYAVSHRVWRRLNSADASLVVWNCHRNFLTTAILEADAFRRGGMALLACPSYGAVSSCGTRNHGRSTRFARL